MGRPKVNDDTRGKLIFDLHVWATKTAPSEFEIEISNNNASIKLSRVCSETMEKMIEEIEGQLTGQNVSNWCKLDNICMNADNVRNNEQMKMDCHRNHLQKFVFEEPVDQTYWRTVSKRQKMLEENYAMELIRSIKAAEWLPQSFKDVFDPLSNCYTKDNFGDHRDNPRSST